MRVTTVEYQELRKTGQFENHRASATVEVGKGENVDKAIELAKSTVRRALGIPRIDEADIAAARRILEDAGEF